MTGYAACLLGDPRSILLPPAAPACVDGQFWGQIQQAEA